MNKLKSFYFLAPVALLIAITGLIFGWVKFSKTDWSPAALAQVKKPGVTNPCWFVDYKDVPVGYEEMMARRDREVYGEAREIPLNEAIKTYNTEHICRSNPYPPLTEDEFLAAIVASADYGKQGEIAIRQEKVLQEILSMKMLPKGSLIVSERGGRELESPLNPRGAVQAKGIRITLLLGMDKNNRMENVLKPEQALVIRKIFSGVENPAP